MPHLESFGHVTILSTNTSAAPSTTSCRCLHGDSCWPSDSNFAALAARVSQPLLHPVPPARPCYADDPSSAACAAVTSHWTDGVWRSDHSGAMQAPNYETFTFPNGTIEACYINTTLGVPCGQGSVSVIGVDAREPADVQAAIKFAAQHNLRLAVKSTGHDYLGRSNGRSSFLLWTHNMKNITIHPTFTPAGAPKNETYDFAITLQSGVQWFEAYNAVTAVNRTIVGGASPGGSVGAASGWLLGGGHSALSPSYGLGVDNTLEITAVTADGVLVTASAYRHSDLFWALRGGGGGSFAVVLSVTYRTHPAVPAVGVFLTASSNTSVPNPALRSATTELVRLSPALTNAGWGGYADLQHSGSTWELTLFAIVPNVSWATANASMEPLLSFVRGLASNSTGDGGLTVLIAETLPFGSWAEWYDALGFNSTNSETSSEVGVNVELGSRLIPRSLVEGEPELVADTLLGLGVGFLYYLVTPGGEAASLGDHAAGVNPAWRHAVAHVVIGTSWAEGTSEADIDVLRAALESDTAKLRSLAPDSGCYFNEASRFEPNFQQAFFGSNYPVLKRIKAKYDPNDLFIVTKGVGSEDWDDSLTCRL
ncbi:FAD-binding domain-containing protein [Epithele typhae]|uniref:FAD-binding domain-containing protein n=1 Tax=Epithele typhae TaxID=378194 RepID=UPI002008769B|nr:FAD-binding domain-containing protein [Epithele typhae]KAH9945279.1 FAD-binding domain-containing protein [Epithele typhae]